MDVSGKQNMINTNRADGFKSVVSLVITWAIFSPHRLAAQSRCSWGQLVPVAVSITYTPYSSFKIEI